MSPTCLGPSTSTLRNLCSSSLDLVRASPQQFLKPCGPSHSVFPDESYEVWCGKRKSPAFYKEKYLVDHVYHTDEIKEVLNKRGTEKLFLLKGQNTDSGKVAKVGRRAFSALTFLLGSKMHSPQPARFPGVETFAADTERLFPVLVELRVHKTDKEVQLLRHVCTISSRAHEDMMSIVQPGMWEFEMESHFLHACYK